MTIIQATIYGIVQGLTEFLPVSSTAHLRVAPALLHWQDPGSAFTAVIQLGTVFAVLIYFWNDLATALKGFLHSIKSGDKTSREAQTGWAVFYATIPISIFGLALHKFIEGPFRSLYVIGSSLIIMGLVMYFVEKKYEGKRTITEVTIKDGIKVGLWQCLSLIPGMSRSGSSITGAFFSGFDKAAATRLSFLMSVPAITLAGVFEGVKEIKHIKSDGMLTPTIIATTVSFVVGYACIRWLIGYVTKNGLKPFVLYRVIAGALIIGLSLANVIDPTAPTKESEPKPQIASPAP